MAARMRISNTAATTTKPPTPSTRGPAWLVDSKYDMTVRKWIERNRKKLDRAWRELTSGKNPKKLVAQLRKAK